MTLSLHDLAPMQGELQKLHAGTLAVVEKALKMKASGTVVVTLDYTGGTATQRASTNGHFAAEGYENRDGGKIHQVAINPYNICNRSPAEIIATFLHEDIHLVLYCNGIKDTSRQGRYHGKTFRKAVAQVPYLETTPDKAIGCRTHLSALGHELVAALNPDVSLLNIGKVAEQTTSKPGKKPHSLVCAVCGFKLGITATDVARILSGDETPDGVMEAATHHGSPMDILFPDSD
jgi:hypothetical protein